jgi:RNA polymerase subunit RPABC4/transcription elongation factor Spt4
MAMGGASLCIGCMTAMEGDGVCPTCGSDNDRPNPR